MFSSCVMSAIFGSEHVRDPAWNRVQQIITFQRKSFDINCNVIRPV